MERLSQFSAIATRERIDGGSGVIYGVSVITIGEAAGKSAGTWIDKKSLSQICEVANKYPDGIKVKLSESKEHDGSAGQIVAVLRTFTVSADRVRANLHLLKTDKNYDKIMEMSATMPSAFGLSIVIPKEIEKVHGKDCLRCSEIYSIDIVEAPAANPSGLFAKDTEHTMNIKYAKGDSGEHAEDCMCRECASKHSKKEMTAFMASLLGLNPEKATLEELTAAFTSKPKAPENPEKDDDENSTDKAGEKKKASKKDEDHEKKMTALSARIDAFEAKSQEAILLSQKSEIASLILEASKAGKQVPFTDEDLLKLGVDAAKRIINNLPANTVMLSGKRMTRPTDKDGKPVTFTTADERMEFCRQKQAEGAAQLNAQFQSLLTSDGLTRN